MAFHRHSTSNYETKAGIVRALDSLLAEKPFDKVTIADICGRVPVAKSTFYRNFEDKPAVVEWYTQHLLMQTVAQIGARFTWREAYALLFREFRRSKRFFCGAAEAKGHRSMRRSNRRTAIEDFTSRVAAAGDPELDFLARYFSSTMIDVMCDWIEGGMAEDPDRMADLLMMLLPKRLEEAFVASGRDSAAPII